MMYSADVAGDSPARTIENSWHCPMMGWGQGMGWFSVAWLITWVLMIGVLIALLRWLWQKGSKE